MNGVGDAHAAAALVHHHHHHHHQQQQQHGMSLPMATSFVPDPANSKPRPPGLPPTPPQAFGSQRADVCMEDGLPPRKAHRRCRSDVPFGYFPPASGGQLPPPKVEAGWGHHGGGDADDLFNTYLNLEGLDGLNSSDDRHDDGDSRGSSMKTNGADSSENESEECAADSSGGIRLWADGTERREGLKRGNAGEPAAAPMARHARSLSMDSLIGMLNFSADATAGANGNMPGPNRFSLEFGSGGFTPAEMKKIMADEKLAEMALADPKRVKRVLANRQSAARSKERKMRYIAELEKKVQILQTEATTLSAQLTLLQRDSAGIATQNNELKFRLQAMEQQAQLRDALNEALTAEVQRLKLATAELGDSCSSKNPTQQIQLSVQDQMFQLQQQQATPIPFYRLQQAQQNGAGKNHESKE
ncbi:bZIP transcription factor 29-like [Phragmites australis]|uniref:bZIP transcription factor 29-like n=1 Tax=Phragmites australis TaxID=29695 RepID=UPI002D77AD77|nr:bZIP transcription factor 29-like [Phragmites australis]